MVPRHNRVALIGGAAGWHETGVPTPGLLAVPATGAAPRVRMS